MAKLRGGDSLIWLVRYPTPRENDNEVQVQRSQLCCLTLQARRFSETKEGRNTLQRNQPLGRRTELRRKELAIRPTPPNLSANRSDHEKKVPNAQTS